MTLRDLYKKHHWQVQGATFYQLHLLFDKHAGEQSVLVDAIAERIQMLGGVTLAMGADIAETTLIARPQRGREKARAQIERLLNSHEIVLKEARMTARLAAERGDDGTNDLIVPTLSAGMRHTYGSWHSISSRHRWCAPTDEQRSVIGCAIPSSVVVLRTARACGNKPETFHADD